MFSLLYQDTLIEDQACPLVVVSVRIPHAGASVTAVKLVPVLTGPGRKSVSGKAGHLRALAQGLVNLSQPTPVLVVGDPTLYVDPQAGVPLTALAGVVHAGERV